MMHGKAPEPSNLRCILIVDDDDLMLTFYRSLFRRHEEEFLPSFADSGEDALLQLKARRFDTAILDWDMPRLSGLSILKAVRANSTTRGMRIIMISGRSGFEDRARALKSGADAFLTKPFEVEALLMKLRATTGH
jgi:DNA-binding response OmpR family regulator